MGLSNIRYVILTIPIIILAIILRKYVSYDTNLISNNITKKTTLSSDELSKYNGIHSEELYLSVIGSIFDVSAGRQHYAKGSPYYYFIGKDGTRALVSGNFNDESKEKDHILDLSCNDIFTILNWRKTFKGKYTFIGLLKGRYYDENGLETPYMREFKRKIKQCKIEKEEAKKQEQIYPPCNMSWSEDDGTKVWCTKSSGGVVRNWEGVPRQLFTPGEEKPQCVCVNLEKTSTNLLKEYDGCTSTATMCKLKN